jgi:4-hydroxythreonine-4-phosphate dehydrogenase
MTLTAPPPSKLSGPRPLRIGLTLGDPAGIGPEIVARTLARWAGLFPEGTAEPVVYGEPEAVDAPHAPPSRTVPVPDSVTLAGRRYATPAGGEPITPGRASAAGGYAAAAAFITALEDAQAGRIDAVVTAPINKVALKLAGFDYPGHTEIIGAATGVTNPVMMLASRRLRTVPLTIHVPLSAVPELITPTLLDDTLAVTDRSLRELFGIAAPRIAVCGLNPHASDHGRFGDEEARVIAPALNHARSKEGGGIDAHGPFAADSLFARCLLDETTGRRAENGFDAVIGMYHDQALIPLKLLSMGQAVNVTLGVPLVRTSVDHGTAYDIAGRGIADEGSLVEAVCLAVQMAQARSHSPAAHTHTNRDRP